MSENKELKKGNGQEPETETAEEGVEGYAYCDSHKARCLNDCGGGGKATPFLSFAVQWSIAYCRTVTKDFRGHWNIRNQHRKYF